MARYQKMEQIKGHITDPQTGETYPVSQTKLTSVAKGVPETAFVKIYYDTYLATIGANDNPLSRFLIAIGKRMTYSTEGQVIHLIKDVREDIAKELGGCCDSSIKKYTKKCVDIGILIKVGGERSATYMVSPYVLGKGDWSSIQALQLEYSARAEELKINVPRPKWMTDNPDLVNDMSVALNDNDTPTLPRGADDEQQMADMARKINDLEEQHHVLMSQISAAKKANINDNSKLQQMQQRIDALSKSNADLRNQLDNQVQGQLRWEPEPLKNSDEK